MSGIYIPLLTELGIDCYDLNYKHLAPTELAYSPSLHRTNVIIIWRSVFQLTDGRLQNYWCKRQMFA
jgi:hypothetical protein